MVSSVYHIKTKLYDQKVELSENKFMGYRWTIV